MLLASSSPSQFSCPIMSIPALEASCTQTASPHLNEWLDLASLSDLLGSHSAGDLAWASVYTSDDSIRVVSRLCALFLSSEDDGLLSGVSACEDDADLAWLDDLWHLEG
jgi:hypothetical protein